MPEPDETSPAQPDPSVPTELGGVSPDELFARGMQSARMSGGGAHGWMPPTPEEVAHLFPNYEILSMLGRGGMGAVYKARQTALDRLVAIKLLPLEISVDQAFADRFRREARAMAKLNHPHIISVFDFGQTSEGHLFFAMEFVEGANLHDIIHGPGLAPDQALSIAVQICTALAYAHGKGVVHRDMKPANVMIDTESQVKVADFGLARLTDPTAETYGTTVTGTVMGTPDYMAPEQMKGMNVDHRADIYSLGVMLYEMLCRETPRGAFELPSARTGCDSRLDAIVLKAMQQAPDRRYQSTQEMKADVESAQTPLIVPSAATEEIQPRRVDQAQLPAPKGGVMKAIPPDAAKKSELLRYLAMSIGAAALVAIVLAAKSKFKSSATAAATPPPAAGSADWTKATDLLPLIAPGGTVWGLWSMKDGTLTSSISANARLQTAYEPPDEYDYRMVFSYDDTDGTMPSGQVEQHISKKGRAFRWVMGARGGEFSAFEMIAGKNAANPGNPTRKQHPPVIARSVVHTSIVEVRNDGIKAYLDGQLAAEWKTDYQGMGFHVDWALRDRNVLGVGSYKTGLKIQKLDVREVTGKGKIVRSSAPKATPQPANPPNPSPASATKAAAFVNTLGMKFVPVPITGGPTGGQRVLFSVWETRVQDYEVFATQTKRDWPKPGFAQGSTHPAVMVDWDDAQAFCAWLTARERKDGKIGVMERYRIPTDHEWSCAVGIGELEDAAKTAEEKSQRLPDLFPWGSGWPPPANSGNYRGEETKDAGMAMSAQLLSGYRDNFAHTGPVGSFAANQFGLFDLGGNAREFCEDQVRREGNMRVGRGVSFFFGVRRELLSSHRGYDGPAARHDHYGFRVVLAPASSKPPAAK